MAAGLAQKFEIRWAPVGHAQNCPAYNAKAPTPAQDRPYRLSKDAADRCHTPCWNDDEITSFTVRVLLFMRHRVSPTNADDLAERLTLRDREQDERRLCFECLHFRPGRCGNHAAAGIGGPALPHDLAALLQRCPGFEAP